MKKRIIVTSGPTNEQIDAVMKITNMSTGALGSIIAETFLRERREDREDLLPFPQTFPKAPHNLYPVGMHHG